MMRVGCQPRFLQLPELELTSDSRHTPLQVPGSMGDRLPRAEARLRGRWVLPSSYRDFTQEIRNMDGRLMLAAELEREIEELGRQERQAGRDPMRSKRFWALDSRLDCLLRKLKSEVRRKYEGGRNQ